MGATEAHEKLKAAKKPDDPGGTRLNYGELFKDGVPTSTFGVGYFEGNPPAEETRQVAKAVMDELATRGYKQDNDTAAEILDKAGRPLSQKTTGQFFVKQNAFSYGPPAGESRQIHAIVRVVFNDVAGGGGAASAAFREGMAVGDAVWYSGHGRYGTGPDFDRNFIEFRLYDTSGKLVQTLDDYVALEAVLRARRQGPVEGLPGPDQGQHAPGRPLQRRQRPPGRQRARQRVRRPPHQLGAREVQHQGRHRPGGPARRGGEEGPAEVPGDGLLRLRDELLRRRAAQDRGLRQQAGRPAPHQPGHARRGRRRRLHGVPDGFVNQRSAEKMLGGLNTAMRKNEHGFSGNPWVFTGLKDNPGAK